MERIVRVETDVAHDVCPWPPYIAKVSLKKMAMMKRMVIDTILLYAYRHKRSHLSSVTSRGHIGDVTGEKIKQEICYI